MKKQDFLDQTIGVPTAINFSQITSILLIKISSSIQVMAQEYDATSLKPQHENSKLKLAPFQNIKHTMQDEGYLQFWS